MAFEREPLMFAISDGGSSLVALLEPDQYGPSWAGWSGAPTSRLRA